jgi:hypothetical protein
MSDLLRWNENLDHPTVGGAEYVKAMEMPMRLTNGRAITYALGLTVAPYGGMREVGHSGSTAGYSTYMSRFPEQHVAVAVWCNGAGTNATALAHQVAELVLPKADVTVAGVSVTHAGTDSLLAARWVGTYREPHTDQTMILTASNNTLSPAGGRGQSPGFTAISGTVFKGAAGDAIFAGKPGRRTMALIRGADTTYFEEVRPSAAIRVEDYLGTYASDELDMRYRVVARDGKLYLTRRPYQEFDLRPVYTDDFATSVGLGTLRFARDARGIVTGFSFYAGRVLDVRFKRIAR